MRGVYTAEIEASISAAKTLVILTAPSSKVLEILSASVSETDVTTDEQWECALTRISTLGSPTATAITPVAHEPGDQASTATASGNVTASEPTYAAVAYDHQGHSMVAGYRFEPIPEERVVVPPSGSIGLRLLEAPTGATNIIAQIVYREIG